MKFSDYMKKEIENLSDDLILSGADKNIKSQNGESIIIGPKKNSFKNIISVAACAVFAVAIAGALLILPGVLPALDTTPGSEITPAESNGEQIKNEKEKLEEYLKLINQENALENSECIISKDKLYAYTITTSRGTPEAVLIYYLGDDESITLPTKIDDIKVAEVGWDKNYGILYNTNVKHVTVPGEIEIINGCAFQKCPIESVTIEEGVKYISDAAFAECKNLKEIVLPESLNHVSGDLFAFCNGLQSVVIKNADWIYPMAFYMCSSLKSVTLPDTLQSILDDAFYGCTALEEIVIPASVKEIRSGAFSDCTSLQNVTILSENIEIAEDAFRNSGWNQDSSTLHTSEDGLYTYYVTSGSAVIIRYHGTEKSVTIPTVIDGISVSKVEGFAYTSEDEPITALTPWGSNTRGIFYNNTNVEEVTVPGSVEIGEGAFLYNASLKKATLENGITTIYHAAFNSCINLSLVNIPESVTFIGDSAFHDCKALTEIEVPAGVEILSGTFRGCENLMSVKLNEGLKQIHGAFAYCYALEKITIPESVGMIYADSFGFCTSLSEVIFLGENTDYEENVFRSTPYAENTGTDIIFTSEDGLYNYYLDGSYAVIVKYIGTAEEITIPTSLDGHTVSMLEGHSLYNDGTIEKKTDYALNQPIVLGILTDSKVKSVTIPASVTIGECAFQGSPELENVTIEKGAISIGYYAFSNCDKLKEITLPDNLYGIGDYAFRDCNALTTVNFGRGLTTIHPYAFYLCDSLTEIVLPDTVESVGTKAFYGCSSLENVKYDHNTVSVDAYAFGETPFGKAMGFSEVSVDISRMSREDIDNSEYYIEGADNAFISEDGKYRYMVKDGGAYISRYLGDEETVVIPDVIDGYPVIMLEGYLLPTRIGDDGSRGFSYHGIFYGCDVKEMIVSESVKFGEFAFASTPDDIKITKIDS